MIGMKIWTKRAGIAITTLLLLAGQATVVLARAGGGKGGSLGGSAGRSFSGGSFSGGGFSGGYSGSYGGFRGFAPFMFFGGPSYGVGSLFGGLFSLIFMMVIIYLIYKALKSARFRRKGGGYYSPPSFGRDKETNNYPPKQDYQDYRSDFDSATPVDVSGRAITNVDTLHRFGKAISYTRENMQYFAETFPRWDRDFIVGRVKQTFFWLQDAWTRQDLSEANEYLTPGRVQDYQNEIAQMRARGERNVIKEPVLNSGDIEFIDSRLDESSQSFIAMIYASLIDYTVNSAGTIVAGEDHHRLYFTEFWKFVWDGERWLLSDIYQEDSLEITKIARGV